ncbi:MAG TPA: DUF1549 domain-containing protein [Planctomycetia bacterium]|nr:DUF1549 domain-containing protein [Planctomycetia bacterium]
MKRAAWLGSLMAALACLGVSLPAVAADKKKKDRRPAAAAKSPKKVAPPAALPRKPNPRCQEPEEVASRIDVAIDGKLEDESIPASPAATDAEFHRRVTLDILGRIPAGERAAKFLDDPDPAKRSKLVDELLASAEYGEHFGGLWHRLLIVPNDDNRQLISPAFGVWMAKQFNDNKPWNETVFKILTASGERADHPETIFWLSHVEGAQKRELKPEQVAGEATRRFLGVQYQCAECHNHPFTGFKQADFWGIAAFFGKTEVLRASKKQAKSGEEPVVRELLGGTATIEIPESKLKPVSVRFPDGKEPPRNANGSLREAFAKWCTSPANKQFAPAAVNRLWGHFFGRGVVHPVDDFRADNPPTHPEILATLTKEFVASGHDLKHLIRCIVATEAYQRTSDALDENREDSALHSHMAVKLMGPEQLFDSLSTALGQPVVAAGRRGERVGNGKNAGSPKARFLQLFNTSEEADFSVDYTHGIPQALELMNGGYRLQGSASLQKIVDAGGGHAKIIDGVFLQVLSRRATPAEQSKFRAYVAAQADPAKAFADIQWVLMNSSEFVLNH